uniref:Asparagine synthetase [glutamine-hydrolyzing] n=1 Tax=Dermatophagoides pteronyssinus TaxID=6956 RepID=A0A6P6YMQ5_DERPT|nr:uncharacterized protein LOC113799841 [Dermatophagoides pteronyssinus]
MCGIFSVFLPDGVVETCLREFAYQASRKQRHRGPDSTGVVAGDDFAIVQERLSIIGLVTGKQPLVSADQNLILAANGEIYNYKELAKLVSNRRGAPYCPRSDSDVILALYEEFGTECASLLWGMFGFIIYNRQTREFFVARDGLGLCSLYHGQGADGRLFVASEMKCVLSPDVTIFPPGCYMTGNALNYKIVEYYKPQWSSLNYLPFDAQELYARLQTSVCYHMNADVPIAAFLSGGLNSSILCYLITRYYKDCAPQTRLKTFTIGMEDSHDLVAARRVAQFLDTDHTEIVFRVDEAIDLLPELIWYLETYDVSTIRAAVPMYILARAARSSGYKVIISGEGANEIFGGYLYFHDAPNEEEFSLETTRRLLDCHLGDGLRANKASLAQSCELRAPFLGSPFVTYAMTINGRDRMPQQLGNSDVKVEKYILRQSFQHCLPEEIIWRQTEQFSDGVGYSYAAEITRYAKQRIAPELLATAAERFPYNTPTDAESYLYRSIFAMEYEGDRRARTGVGAPCPTSSSTRITCSTLC